MKISLITSLLALLLVSATTAGGDTAVEEDGNVKVEVDVVEVETTATTAEANSGGDGGFQITEDMSILDVLDPAIVNDPEIIEEIQYNLQAGNLIVLKDAFIPEFAHIAWSEMNSEDRIWKSFTTIRKNGHNFFKHRPSQKNREGTLNDVRNVFKHVKSREFFTMLSGRDCMSEKEFSALPSQYKKGDHSNPHTDRRGARTLTFLWQLAKNWKPEWGGAFFWNKAYYENGYQHPSYNTLLLFSVTTKSVHMVTPVTKKAKGKRLNFGGWYSADLPESDEDVFDIKNDLIEERYATEEARRKLSQREGKIIIAFDVDDPKYGLSEERKEAILELQDRVLDEGFEPHDDEALYILGPPEDVDEINNPKYIDDEDEETGGVLDSEESSTGGAGSPVCDNNDNSGDETVETDSDPVAAAA